MKDRLSPTMKDILSGLLALAFAVWLLIGCETMNSYASNLLKPDFLPRVLAWLLIALGVYTIVKAIILRRKETKAATVQIPAEKTIEQETGKRTKKQIFNELVPYMTFVLIALYLVLMQAIGFAVSSSLYLMAQINLLEQKRTPKRIVINCIIGVVVAVTVFLIFREGFGMHLPTHRWGSLGKF